MKNKITDHIGGYITVTVERGSEPSVNSYLSIVDRNVAAGAEPQEIVIGALSSQDLDVLINLFTKAKEIIPKRVPKRV